jgi:hypothetical protein
MHAAFLQAAPLLAIPSLLRLEQFLLSKQEEGYRALLQQVRMLDRRVVQGDWLHCLLAEINYGSRLFCTTLLSSASTC